MRQYMGLHVVHVNQWLTQPQRQPFGERCTHHQRTQQARPAGKGYRIKLARMHTTLAKRLLNNCPDILLMSAGCQFRHNTTKALVNALRGNNIIEYFAVANKGR